MFLNVIPTLRSYIDPSVVECFVGLDLFATIECIAFYDKIILFFFLWMFLKLKTEINLVITIQTVLL